MMILLELFTSDVKHKVLRDERTRVEWEAEIGRRMITVGAELKPSGDGVWEIAFYEHHGVGDVSFQVTNSGNAGKVFAFIRKFIVELLNKPDVKQVRFTAHGESRVSAYEAMLTKLIPSGWEVLKRINVREVTFAIQRK